MGDRGPRPRAERFWAKVDKTGTCWLWTGAPHKGRGLFFDDGGRRRRAQKVAWELATGRRLADSDRVLQSCGHTMCVRHLHLRPPPKPPGRPRDKLNARKVRWLRAERAKGRELASIASDLGVTMQCVHLAATGKTWSSVS